MTGPGKSGSYDPRWGARDWVNWLAPHRGQCRSCSAGWLPAEIDVTSRLSSARSTVRPPGAAENMEIDRVRRRAADRGTRHA